MESSAEIAMRDGGVVSRIVGQLLAPNDRHSASMVCKTWNDAVIWGTQDLTIRSRSLLPYLVHRFKHVKVLNLTHCSDQLQDSDLRMISASFQNLTTLLLGNPEEAQEVISNLGLVSFVKNCGMLEHVGLYLIPNLQDSGVVAMARECRNLRSLSLENCRHLSDDALESLSNCKCLRELSLKGIFGFTATGLSRIGQNCPSLLKVSLEFDFLDVTLALKSLALHCVELRELSLRFRHGDLGELAGLSTLVSLHVDTDQRAVADVPLSNIVAANRGLKELVCFNRHYPPSDAVVTMIVQNCKKLEKLCLVASRLTESALLGIMECKALRCLALHNFYSEGQGLAAIGLCGMQLKEFSLRFARGVRDVELETLMCSNKQLERIDLHCCVGPSSRGFSAIGLCSNLQHLDLSFTDLDDLSLATIANAATMLRHLSLVKCEVITDMKVLSKFRALEYLNIDQCPFVTDEGLDFLAAGCSKLSYLSLASTRITDIGLSYLASCSLLQTLRIPYCRGVQGPGLITIALSCSWIRYLVISYRFRDTKALEQLKKRCCMVRLEVDDMALVPFGFYAFDLAADISDHKAWKDEQGISCFPKSIHTLTLLLLLLCLVLGPPILVQLPSPEVGHHCTYYISIFCLLLMDRHIYRPVPERAPYRSLTGLLSQGSMDDVDDDILDIATQSTQFSPFRCNSPLQNQGDFVVNIEDDNNMDQPIANDITTTMKEIHGSKLQQQGRQQTESRRKEHVVSPQINNRARWTITETLILIDAKRVEKDLQRNSGIRRKTLTATEKWRAIEKYCYDNGVMKSASQCRDRWEHIHPEYKKVRDYEKNIPSGHDSYWSMTIKERQNKKLPSNYIEELFHAMDKCFGHDRSIDAGDISIDTSSTKYGIFNESHSQEQNDPACTGAPDDMADDNDTPTPIYVPDELNMQSTGKKRKSTSRITGLKDTLSENTKVITDALHLAEEGRMKRHEQDREMFERKMERDEQIEEQKVKVQIDLVSALNTIGQAMLKISQSFEKE